MLAPVLAAMLAPQIAAQTAGATIGEPPVTDGPAVEQPVAEYVVLYQPGTNMAAETRDLVLADDVAVDEVFTDVVPAVAVEATAEAIADIAQDPAVLAVEPNREFSIAATQTSPIWNLDRIDQANLPLNGSYSYPDSAGSGVDVYVVDTGVKANHVDFSGRVVSGYSTVEDGNGTDDCQGHGTHVASTAAGTSWGVAKSATIVPVRVLGCDGSGYLSDVVEGLNWIASVASGPSVVNMSLGSYGASTTMDAAIDNLVAEGITVVVAAGNSNDDACAYTPAATASALTVAATDSTDTRADFSNYGSCVDLFAPGVGIKAAYKSTTTSTATMAGTSMASPHVAGVVALILGENPSATPAQVTQSIINGATSGIVSDPVTGTPNRLLVIPTIAPPPPTPTPPGVFSKTFPISGSTVSNQIVTLTWNASPSAEAYDVCLSTSSRCRSWTRVAGTSYTTPALANGSRYYWQVRAINDLGTALGDAGTSWTFRTSFPVISTRSLPSRQINTFYSAPLSASGGIAPYSWSTSPLPSGLTLTGNVISGTPTTAGTYSVTVTVTDANGGTSNKVFSLRLTPPPPGSFAKTFPMSPAAVVSQLTLTLTWTPSAHAEWYDVCVTSSSRCRTWTRVAGTSFTTPVLNSRTSYTWQVRAGNATGTTLADNNTVWSFTTPS